MKEVNKKRSLTISAGNYAEFDRLFNETADRLAKYEPEVKDIDALTSRFFYTESESIAEDLEEDFDLNHQCPRCFDCPHLQIGKDARRKWFPCEFASYGKSSIDSPVCMKFYEEAVEAMRAKAGRE